MGLSFFFSTTKTMKLDLSIRLVSFICPIRKPLKKEKEGLPLYHTAPQGAKDGVRNQ